MSTLCCRVPSFHPSAFSFGNFVKHLAVVWPAGVASAQIHAGCAADPEKPPQSSLPKFEFLDPRQKERVRLYVESLLQWKQGKRWRGTSRTLWQSFRRNATCARPFAILKGICVSLMLVVARGFPVTYSQSHVQVTLLVSMEKRYTFLVHAVTINELKNVEVVRGRAEDLGHNLQFRECFDVAVARAVAEMRFLDEYCLPLVRVGGLFVTAKGHDPQDEVKNAGRAIQLMGGSVESLYQLNRLVLMDRELRSFV